MNYTNKYGLPETMVRALMGDDYDLKNAPENIISVTALIAPAKLRILEARHYDEIEVDVSESLWKLLGQACHYVTEKAAGEHNLTEERWYLEVSTMQVYTAPLGVKAKDCKWYKVSEFYVSGKLDLYDSIRKNLSDYKITSIWSWVIEKKIKPEHEAQLNINALALRIIGFPVLSMSIMVIFRDWSKKKSKFDYPDVPIPMKEIKCPSWNDISVQRYIKARVEYYLKAKGIPDDEIAECLPEERWAKPTTYAVMKPGNKRALKVFDQKPTDDQIAQYKGCSIQERPGTDNRCTEYCNSAPWCHYWKQRYGKTEYDNLDLKASHSDHDPNFV